MIAFKQWLEDQPIQKKWIYSNLFGTALALVPVIVIMVAYEYYALRNQMLDNIRIQADIVGESSAAAMAFGDEEAAAETLRALHNAPDLIEAHLILPDGSFLKSYYPGGCVAKREKLKPASHRSETLTLSTITIAQPVYLRYQYVGALILSAGLDAFYLHLLWFGISILSATVLGFLIARWIAKRISKTITEPLISLTAATHKIMTEQDYTAPVAIDTQDEVGGLSRAFGEMMSQIHRRDLTLQQLAYYDRVTGIANRHFFEERIAQAVENAQRYGRHCHLMMIDLDDFKIVNDRLGHHIGDLLLHHVSNTLSNVLRLSDAIFRIGGDEFAVIVESGSDNDTVEKIAQKIIQAISTPVKLEDHEVSVGASIGISSFPKYSNDVRTLMSTADMAMYVAKGNGKNNYHIYERLEV